MPEPDLTFADLVPLTTEAQGDCPPGSEGWDPDRSQTKRINAAVIEAMRANGGKVPGELEIMSFVLVTAKGAKSGIERTVPLLASVVEERLLVVASLGGAEHNPPWFHNVVANPDVVVEWQGERYAARAVVHEGAERDRLFAAAAEQNPVFAGYQERTTRLLPVVELVRA